MSKENQIRVVAVSTVLSRLTGFFRDVLVFAVFGTSAINSAFIIAFTIPNLFRRFMGEGALTSALVPALAHEQQMNGKEGAFELFNKVMTRAAVVLAVVVVIGVVIFQILEPLSVHWKLEERWTLAAKLGAWVFPYLIFVCLAALIGAALNLQKKFASTALAQIWVNLMMALMLVVGVWVAADDLTRMMWLVGGVLVGGALQLMLPGYALTREGWKPRWDAAKSKNKELEEMWGMFGPGLLGATVAQIDTAISQLLAFGLNDAATSVLFLSNRLMQLPLGVFAIAVTTVTFPMIARKAAEGDKEGFAQAYRDSSMLIQAVMIPAGVGLAILAEPILVSFFKWGSFDAHSVSLTAPILMTYALGIPFFAGLTLTTRALHSLKDMKTPVRWGVMTLIINLVMSLILKEIWGTFGLALSNVLSTAIFAWGLRYELKKKTRGHHVPAPFGRLLIAGGIMAAAVTPLLFVFPHDKMGRFLTMLVGAPVGVAVYAVALYYLSRESFVGIKKLVWR